MSAEERRESVIRAAITEFARGGYNATSTEAIAKRVGVSQPYLFRLFPSKQAMFLAAVERCLADTRKVFAEAAEGLEGEEAVRAVAAAYQQLIVEDPDKLQMQMQIYAAVASADAAGEREVGDAVRAAWLEMWDETHLILGADAKETATFWAFGMLINTLASLGFPAGHRVWSGLCGEARPTG
ncbi:TetR/AcrR family transcriptional regulator [Streptomyces sp. NBC_00257]|uniref:TetR/AcrR family transcriptional regulator n=1 Tax=Streptomyces TaxID=1883 RepID=UPI00224E080C|nr:MULTISPECIES: TetR/AcrR family transcriptional regulator [unclassified Streptomyces]WSW06020.1 TetR/AcrR family transcriptional regulator [Streptomyces sp. NBC_01005]WTB56140.1 TetR/AcrR family transcriptional regulator [Streptomyces sp. NBC_00826]WTC95524.1 TetR/AcrR family transcriptional regulator [Streptomyces sp. NBC_01650]WTH90978.1 TetR/AcrR family transcriptional regulator [Streptomyces sp. NBC_00825]WTH99704.1 TetR/AcrR family transcriptional regulator [Streptomyces sp. NBC_00822]